MRISAIALGVLLAAGCNAPHEDTAESAVADASAPEPSTQPGAPPAVESTESNIVPAQFRGEYATDATSCRSPGHESRLTIGAWRITFHESAGTIIAVESGRNDLTVTAELTGEGETRQATYHFKLSDDGQTLTDTDSGMTRQRC